MEITKKSLLEESYIYNLKYKFDSQASIGPLGMFKGKLSGYSDEFEKNLFYPNYPTNQGNFYKDEIEYKRGNDIPELEGETYRDMELLTMKMKGKYVTLYTFNIDKGKGKRISIKKIAKKLFD